MNIRKETKNIKHKMNELLEAVKDKVGSFLIEKDYNKRGKADFVKKIKLNKREEVISFSSRKGRKPYTDYLYIGITSGIYYKEINLLDKKIVQDFMNSYPIISGSIGHFRDNNSGFISIPINNETQVDEVSQIIIQNIDMGAFNLFSKYSTLDSILLGIEKKDDWFMDYHKFLKTRRAIRLAAIYCLVKDKDTAINWFKSNIPNTEKEKLNILEKMKVNW